MEFKGTVERLMSHIAIQNDLFAKNASVEQLAALDRLIQKDIYRVKANVMTHCFFGLAYFNGKE